MNPTLIVVIPKSLVATTSTSWPDTPATATSQTLQHDGGPNGTNTRLIPTATLIMAIKSLSFPLKLPTPPATSLGPTSSHLATLRPACLDPSISSTRPATRRTAPRPSASTSPSCNGSSYMPSASNEASSPPSSLCQIPPRTLFRQFPGTHASRRPNAVARLLLHRLNAHSTLNDEPLLLSYLLLHYFCYSFMPRFYAYHPLPLSHHLHHPGALSSHRGPPPPLYPASVSSA